MAISRMQQPRQMYGLGSFVKKATKKITKPFVKVAKKIVPKEIAGIMRVAAPFLPPQLRAAAYLLGTARQTGRISPVDLALVAAPRIGKMKIGGQSIQDRLGALNVPFTGGKDLKEVLVGKGKETLPFQGPIRQELMSIEGDGIAGVFDPGMATETFTTKGLGQGTVDATSGIFGEGGKFFQFGAKDGPKILETKAGQALLGKEKPDGTFGLSLGKAAGIGVGLLSLVQNAETPEEAGNNLAAATGNSDDYERGYQLFSQLTPELFRVPERFRMEAQSGGLMRTNYALGSDDNPNAEPINPFKPKPIGPILPEEDKPFTPRPLKPLKMAGMDRKDRAMELADMLAEEEYGMDFYDLDIRTQMKIYQIALDMIDEGGNAMGGKPNNRMDLALGTKPTPEESGLGGLPIEADMRYTGGFMPYGAKEKADDVPARLSKNEFVFTADAVRAAGGGSVNEGAKKMYATMKQLEAKPEAKGMRA